MEQPRQHGYYNDNFARVAEFEESRSPERKRLELMSCRTRES